MQIYGTKEGVYIGKGINSHRISTNMTAVTSCENALFKYARAVKQKVWNESQNRERDWGETLKIRFFSLASHALRACKARAGSARKTLTPRLPISLLILRKKPTVLQSNLTRKYFFMCR